jgi:hypothetical protein
MLLQGGVLAKTFLALPIERIRRALAGTAWHFFVGPIPDAATEAGLLALADLVAVALRPRDSASPQMEAGPMSGIPQGYPRRISRAQAETLRLFHWSA